DTCLIRKQRFISVFSPGSVHFVVSAWNMSTVQRRAQCTQVDQEKPARLSLEPNSCVLSRHIDRRHDFNVDRICDTATTDSDRRPDIVGMMAGCIVKCNPRE